MPVSSFPWAIEQCISKGEGLSKSASTSCRQTNPQQETLCTEPVATIRPAAACESCLRQHRFDLGGVAYRLATATPAPPLTHVVASFGYEPGRHNGDASKLNEEKRPEANRRKGELRASSPFPLGGYSALPRTGGTPRPLEARPYGRTMPAHARSRHLDLAARRRQALIIKISSLSDLQQLPSNLSEIVLHEAAPVAEEPMIGRAIRMPLVAQRSQFDAADIIRDLGHVIVLRHCISVDSGIARQTHMNRTMHGMLHDQLPVIVIDLHANKGLKERQALVKKGDQIPFDLLGKMVNARKATFSVNKRVIPKRRLLNEETEPRKEALSVLKAERCELVMPAHHRCEMKCMLHQAGVLQGSSISPDIKRYLVSLIVKNKRYEVVVRAGSDIAGLINENRKLPHEAISCLTKMPGETPRRRDSPPCVERCSIYTTRRLDHSILAKYEHMFSIIDTNICSPYGKAA